MDERPCNIMMCEFLVHKYLPSMRAELVTRLINEKGISQSEAARRLGITRAAVSQYLSRKRGGSEIEITDDLNALIERWAVGITDDSLQICVCDVCRCAMKKM